MQASMYFIPEDKLAIFFEWATVLLEPVSVQNPSHQWLLFLHKCNTAKYSQVRDQMNIAMNVSMHSQTACHIIIAIFILPMSLVTLTQHNLPMSF